MRFMSLFRPAKDLETAAPPCPDEMGRMGAFMEEELRKGTLVSTGGLGPSSRGVLVRRTGDAVSVVDGPYAEAKELVLGFAILNARSKEELLGAVKRFLAVAGDGVCDVRPVFGPDGNLDAQRYMSLFRPAARECDMAKPPSEQEQVAMRELMERESKAGILVTTGGLGPSAAGARVRRAGSEWSVLDGPFGPAERLVAGWAILEVPSKAEAIAAAKRFMTLAGDGECELRPYFGWEDPPCAPH